MTPANAKNQDNGDEFSFMTSQASNGSDDHMLQQALAERVFAAKEKKKKEMEKKFLAAGQQHLVKETANTSTNIQSTYQAANEELQRFIMEYVSVEDKIRALWDQLRREQQSLASIAEKRRMTLQASAQGCEAKHIKAMGLVKEACYGIREPFPDDRITRLTLPHRK
ncbi:uncharacterized protein BT62DRAFT_1005712 [Guyanagaster necrorhizus]|uniref:Uncharacterized protein n=1 Tax=Guyanagaster necrorhizus TaxID=856835 RepID=A0A9P8AU15_9AGAR|nr:uncharacterized protein BT62DRAFT_1005712 [Guyanagaster necrorhizus MCA 3950]KAG7446437.1 hypothetical protein BT62DRAFT_1005712 [Guyanagaster necrorhizus MCA 3950]